MRESVGEKDTTRVEAFSDGVFAIAITLLILDIRVPRPPEIPGEPFDLAQKLLALWSPILAFLMSFTIVLGMWINHHRIFSIVKKTDDAFLFWNGLLLLAVTVVPFPTALLSEYMAHGGSRELRIAAMVYATHGMVISLAFGAVWRYATRDGGHYLIPGHTQDQVRRKARKYRFAPLAYVLALGVAVFWPWGSVAVCLGLALFFSVSGLTGAAER